MTARKHSLTDPLYWLLIPFLAIWWPYDRVRTWWNGGYDTPNGHAILTALAVLAAIAAPIAIIVNIIRFS